MSDIKLISGLGDISEHYDILICDVWGVLHDGRRAFEGACEALLRFRETGGVVILVSNAPVPGPQVLSLCHRVGVPEGVCDAVVTSGDATRQALIARAPGPFYRLGPDQGYEHDDALFEGLSLSFADPDEAAAIVCIGLRDQMNDAPDSYRLELEPLARRKVEMICANPDIQVRIAGRLMWCAGALARVYEQLGGPVVYPGKPHAPIYDLALERAEDLLGQVPSRSRILAIGDGPETDVRGANRQGFDCLFVASGLNQGEVDITRPARFRAAMAGQLYETGVEARYLMAELAW
jgi:HAD superfamily hydrolase (TIGR01459 family)